MERTEFEIFAVVLAGGSGTRFWPKSRLKTPKQLCKLGGAKITMLEATLQRLQGIIPPTRRIIVTHKDQVAATRKIAGKKCARVIPEPEARNTANALALAAIEINRMAGGKPAIMVSLHADALVTKVDEFKSCVMKAIKVAASGKLTLMGIVPKYAETGYGYIEKGSAIAGTPGFAVKSFREKPDAKTATSYVNSGKFLWNSGIFVFPVQKFIDELRLRLPSSVEGLEKVLGKSKSFASVNAQAMARAYKKLPKIAIDNAVLEVADDVAVIDADIGWQDIGSWDALSTAFPVDSEGNLAYGPNVMIDSKNTTIDTDGPLIATIGLEDMIVVHSRGAILVCPKSRAQDVKKVVEVLNSRKQRDLL